MYTIKRLSVSLTALLLLSMALMSCNLTGATQVPEDVQNAALTQAAATIFAELAQTVEAFTDTPEPPPPSDTPDLRPTQTPLITDTPDLTETVLTPSPTTKVITPSPTFIALQEYYSDDFEGNQGWATMDEHTVKMWYTAGDYHIWVKMFTGDSPVYSVRSFGYAEVSIAVDIITDLGPSDSYFGVMCRFVDSKNYYRFVVGRDGYYNIGKKLAGEFVDLVTGNNPDVFKQGDAINNVRGVCTQNTLVLYLNGVELAKVSDFSFAAGKIGLVVGTRSEKEVEVGFDNVVLSAP